ncbi:uncharacterized protein LOC135341193 isoform X2 [Halichondria panicea]|uniref:uncharacterized protein LOC135341193 isoform X2 n=1 Tax=Halichondria panicea TaxID=6063 RepID=UPI00312B7D1A
MNSWSRDGGFYKCPVVKSLLVLTGASSLLDYILSVQTHYSNGLLFLHVWALPTPGTWLLAAMILYYCRVLEKRESSTKFLSKLCLSCALGVGATWLLAMSTSVKGAQLIGSKGALVHTVVGVLLVQYLTTVVSPHSGTLMGLRHSGSIPFYLLSVYAGSLLVHSTRIPVPSLPKWVESGLARLLGRDTPPKRYSGASLQVQRQQRMDEMENMLQQIQQRQVFRTVRIGGPVPVQPVEPPAAQVEQLVRMGFTREDSVRALRHTGSNLEAAAQLLSVPHHH